MTDETLIREALAGDRGCAEQLFTRHFDDAWRAAFAVTASRSAADDVTQAALEHAFARLSQFSGKGPFGAWLRRIVVNHAVDDLRKRRRTSSQEVPLEDVAADWDATSPDPVLASSIRGLEPDRRAMVVLHHWLGYTVAEAAEILDIPPGTAASRLARAMQDLRVAMGVTS